MFEKESCMRFLFLVLVSMFLISCAPKQVLDQPPLGYSFMPRYLDLDSVGGVIPNDTAVVVDASFRDYKSLPLDSGRLITTYKDTLFIPPGVLISERKAALYAFYQSSWERQKTQLKYSDYLFKSYYDKAKSAENLYQAEIARLQKDVKRTWLEKNAAYIGFLAGSMVVVLTLFATESVTSQILH